MGTPKTCPFAWECERFKRAVTATGAQILFLPACSPDLNPIEKRWSKIKNFLRQVEARTEAALIEAIGAALALVIPPRRKKLVCRLWLQYY